MGTIFQDLRFAFRLLKKDIGFTSTAVLTLALGIGANCAIFSVINAVLIRPLPFADSGRIVDIGERDAQGDATRFPVSVLDLGDFRDRSQSFELVGAYASQRFNVSGMDEPQRVSAARVSAEVFQILGVKPLLGRAFESGENLPGNGRIVVVCEGLWRRSFHSDKDIISKSIILDGMPYTVVGVMPNAFEFPISVDQVELWVPIVLNQYEGTLRGYRAFNGIGRLKRGVAPGQAQAELVSIAQQLEQAYPDSNKRISAIVGGLHEDIVKDSKPALLMLLGAVALVLAIACANVASLVMARAISREREIGIRSALGASTGRLVRQLLIEGLLLSFIAGAASLLVARVGIGLLQAVGDYQIPRIEASSVDWPVLAFALSLCLLTGLIFGFASILQASNANPMDPLRESRSQAGGVRLNRARAILIVAEVALSLVLLVGAGLLINSFIRLSDVNPGIQPRNVLTMQVTLTGANYMREPQSRRYYHEVLDRIASAPGVDSAAAISHLPLSQASASVGFSVVGKQQLPGQKPTTGLRLISPNYFRTMGIPTLGGRDFSDADGDQAPKVVIINRSLAQLAFPGEDPLGKRIELTIGDPVGREVVGVVGDVRYSGLNKEPGPEVYLPYLQLTFPQMTLVIRTSHDPLTFAGTARTCAMAVDNTQAVAQIKTMDQYIAQSIEKPRFSTVLVSLFALLALIIATIGVYGVTSYSVNQRTREIGVRMALGAARGRVLKLVVGQAMVHTIIGVIIGVGGAFASTRALAGQLFGVRATDPGTFVVVSLVLGVASFVASYIPARRATCVDPTVALRYE
jgi:putative ABC transport system permease protein